MGNSANGQTPPVPAPEDLPPEEPTTGDAPDTAARARDLVDAAELFHRLWALHCRLERAVFGARNTPEDIGWRADAIELLDQWDRGGAQ